ncbi:MAG: hypothetical protein M3186_04695 [Actinomycetota bacterium]|nr:hypothetical protein [Actinomycetota bacterium]
MITSRRKLTGLTDAYPLSLDVLGWDEAEQLFVKLVGAQRWSSVGPSGCWAGIPDPRSPPVVIAALADVPTGRGRQLLRELVDHNLLDQLSVTGVPGGRRYRMHDLGHLYARERADAQEPAAERAAAVDRLAGSYLAITREADRLLRSYLSGDRGNSAARSCTDVWRRAAGAYLADR